MDGLARLLKSCTKKIEIKHAISMTEVLIRSYKELISNRFLPQLVLTGSCDCSVVSHRDTEK